MPVNFDYAVFTSHLLLYVVIIQLRGRSIQKSPVGNCQQTPQFRLTLKSEIENQAESFSVFCILMPDQNDLMINNHAWHRAVETTLDDNISPSTTFELIEDKACLAAIIGQCCFNDANTLARLVRNNLMRSFPSHKPSMAISYVDVRALYNNEFNADELLEMLCIELDQNASRKSSRIDVKRFQLKL